MSQYNIKLTVVKSLPFLIFLIAAIFAHKIDFSVLFVALIGFMFLPFFYRNKIDDSSLINKGVLGTFHFDYGYQLSYLILIFGFIATLSLNNYVNPPQNIFRNSDHHALRVDGVKMKSEDAVFGNFRVAGGDNQSFLDDASLVGSAMISGVSSDSVKLRLRGFTQPLYLHQTTSQLQTIRQTVVNSGSLLSFNSGDTVTFHSGTGSVRFYIEECHEEKKYEYSLDSAIYTIINSKGERLQSNNNQFLRKGLSLSSLLSDIPTSTVDFNGIDIIRPNIYPLVKRKALFETYNGEYAISLSSQIKYSDSKSKITSISIAGKRYKIDELLAKTVELSIPFDRYMSVGFGEEKSKVIKFECDSLNMLSILYDLPQYQCLTNVEDKTENSLYFTSTLLKDGELDPNLSDQNILFNLFNHSDNIHHLTPATLSYGVGESGQAMHYSLSYTTAARATSGVFNGEKFKNIKGRESDVEWIVSVENFRETTPFSLKYIVIALWLTIALSVISILSGSTHKAIARNGGKFLSSHLEYAVYLVAIAFITIRLFLLWRVTVFPPVDNIAAYDFNHLRNFDIYQTLLIGLAIFYGSILIFKFIIYRRALKFTEDSQKGYYNYSKTNSYENESKSKRVFSSINKKFIGLLSFMILAYILAAIVAKFVPIFERFTAILIPMVIYVVFEFAIYRIYNQSYPKIKAEDDVAHKRNVPLILSFINIAIVTTLFLLLDGGFGIMFLAFAAIWTTIKLIDLNSYSRNNKKWFVLILQIVISCVALIIYKKFILNLLDTSPSNNITGVVVIWISVAALLAIYSLAISVNLFKGKHARVSWLVIALLSTGITYGVSEFQSKIEGSHLEFRSRVLMSTPDEILSNIEFERGDETKFLQASLNDWILKEYSKAGDELSDYFQLQPHSRLGALWFAQTTDIVLARFIISEHSRFLPILFIFAFLALSIIAMVFSSRHRWSRMIIMQIPLLFTIQALYIWMANTRQFIFFGQDFPLLSITSKLSIAYFFVLMLVVVILASFEMSGCKENEYSDDEYRTISLSNGNMTKNFILFNAIPIVLIVLGLFIYTRSEEGQNSGYSIDKLLANTSATFETINKGYLEYQQQRKDIHKNPVVYQTNMSQEMRRFVSEVNIDSLFDISGDTTTFSRSIFNNYVAKTSHNNSSDGLLHIHKNRDGELEFGVKQEYYNLNLPLKSTDSWTGSIVENRAKTAPVDTLLHFNFKEYDMYNLPSSWFTDGKQRSILKAKSNSVKIGTNGVGRPVEMRNIGLMSVMSLGEFDNLFVDSKRVENLPIIQQNYLARNLIINGQNKFVYPLGSDLFWARNFAQHISLSKRDMLTELGENVDEIDNSRYQNVNVTLNVDLTKSLSSVLKKYSRAMRDNSVIVADGNGMIRAMVDYKPRHRLNPNDYQSIEQKVDSLYMNGLTGKLDERLYLGNSNLIPLNNGPGSTQKPIVWSAVTSAYNVGYWDDLELAKINASVMGQSLEGYFVADYFAGVKLKDKPNFKSIKSDEGSGVMDVDFKNYIFKSSNYYNSLMVYMGSFPADMYANDKEFNKKTRDKDNKTALLRRVGNPSKMSKDDYHDNFPIMKIDDSYYAFNRDLDVSDAQSTLLHSSLYRNYGLTGSYSRELMSTTIYPSIKHNTLANYVYPESSILNIAARTEGSGGKKYLYENMVRSTTIGARKVWEITPLKMAEMYGILVSQNREYRLTIDPTQKMESQEFIVDKSWRGDDYDDMRKELFEGLSEVFKRGTAKSTGIKDSQINGKSYFVYGKTGTINSSNGVEDHLLVTVITNTDLTQDKVNYKNLKFYVIYSTQYNSSTSVRASLHRAVYDEVVKSECFKEYMEK